MSLYCSVKKSIGTFSLEADFEAADGEFLSLLGPSGCGKTTLLRLIAGLIKPDEGSILIDGRDVSAEPAYKRGIGFVFQDYALFPHRDVRRNIAYGLERKRIRQAEIGNRVSELLELVGLSGYERREVTTLSGGEQQRVALARALAPEPRLLLLDEPLSALDPFLRDNLRRSLRSIQKRLSLTTVYVTHDQEEALSVSDRIVLLREGRVEQKGTPYELYENPRSLFAGKFVGEGNSVRGRVVEATHTSCRCAVGDDIVEALQSEALKPGESVVLFFRPEHGRFTGTKEEGNTLSCRVCETEYIGRDIRIWLNTGRERLMVFSVSGKTPGGDCLLYVPRERIRVFRE